MNFSAYNMSLDSIRLWFVIEGMTLNSSYEKKILDEYFDGKKKCLTFFQHKLMFLKNKYIKEIKYDNPDITIKWYLQGPGEIIILNPGVYHQVKSLTKKRLSCSFPILTTHDSNVFDEREWLSI